MKLVFLGTRGYIERRTARHRMHTSMMVSYRGQLVMLDCGEDWLGLFEALHPRAIVVTHAHPDHVFGLKDGASCPVYATRAAWRTMSAFPIKSTRRRILKPGRSRSIEGIVFTPLAVEHSTRAPAVGYRITTGRVTIFYVPDVAWIPNRSAALRGVRAYIGDGATIARPMTRMDRHARRLTGHAPIRTQLTWCEKEGLSRMIVTHCGSEIVGGAQRSVETRVRRLGRDRGVHVAIAYDGMEVVLR